MKKIGLIVNPIAGMGGAVGLKGTDGPDALSQARELGATPRSSERATAALTALSQALPGVEILTVSGAMGETAARAAGFAPALLEQLGLESTSADDTRRIAAELASSQIDLLLFAGGDGTARDIFAAVGTSIPALGIPTGVKMHSAVYATSPRAAGEAAASFLGTSDPQLREAEVMDIDEEAFRGGRVSARLFGALMVPDLPRFVQQLKSGSTVTEGQALAEIADEVIERMRDGALYIVGPGSTTRTIVQRLGGDKTLLGVDLYSRGELIAKDVTEQQILEHLESGVPARIVVTPIGGQGFVFGRGNQQLSAKVIQKVGRANIVIVATHEKMAGLEGEPLLVDTGDPDTDTMLAGYIRVVTGYHNEAVYKIR